MKQNEANQDAQPDGVQNMQDVALLLTLFQSAVLVPPAKSLATVGTVPWMFTAPPLKALE